MSLFELSDAAIEAGVPMPSKAHPGDAGYDLACLHDVTIKPGARSAVHTGITLDLPDGYWAEIKGRSGHALASGIQILGDVIDNGYTGEVIAILLNTDQSRTFHAKAGSRVAQLVLKPLVELVEPTPYDLPGHREVMEALGKLSIRGENAFGSSGS